MELFTYWLKGFTNMADYHSPARRSELNYFVLMQIIINIALIILSAIIYTVLTLRGIDRNSAAVLTSPMFLLIFLITNIPLMALIKRRLIDVIPNRANLLFWIMFAAFVISTACQVAGFFTLVEIFAGNFSSILFLKYFILCIINFIFTITYTIGFITLMCKKGNI